MKRGDRVKYSVRWLRAAGLYTGPVPFARGTVVAVEQFGDRKLVTVDWDGNDDIPTRVLVSNLALEADLETRDW